ncbi:TA system VapC family ribonuclease toxin [Luteolibacter soli]|uniref:Ribonuclease VapC n=1 Tax=Luteolibacter soli TaxID=3135280 RepID=A0ABU9B2C0_9BACT
MIRLADIPVLIALADPRHVHHVAARRWLVSRPDMGLATCPLTESGFLRIYGHPSYPHGPGSPEKALMDLRAYRARRGHHFLPCDLSLSDPMFTSLAGLAPQRVTGIYLVALALKYGIRFATFDANLPTSLVARGSHAVDVIPV